MVSPAFAQSISNLLRFGYIAEVIGTQCRVQTGGVLTDLVGCFVPCAGQHNAWCPLSVGEQVLLLCPEGDLANAVALRGLHSAAFPPPTVDTSICARVFADGTRIQYDSQLHVLTATLAQNGQVDITAPSGLTLHGPLTIHGAVQVHGNANCSGRVAAEEDVVAAGISLRSHVHGQVQPGSGLSGAPA